MTEDQMIGIVGTLGAVVLVGAAIISRRRLESRRLLCLTLIWIAIIASVWAAVTITLHYILDLT